MLLAICLLAPAAFCSFPALPKDAEGTVGTASSDVPVQDRGAEILWSHAFNDTGYWYLCDDGTVYAKVGDSPQGPFRLVRIGTAGEIMWSYRIEQNWSPVAMYNRGIVYILELGNYAGTMTAVGSDGAELWTLDCADIPGLSLPVVFDGAMVPSPDGGVVIHAPISGRVPGIPDSTFYLYIDPSGSVGWSVELPITRGSMYVGESPELGTWIVSSDKVFHLDREGALNWTLDLDGQSSCIINQNGAMAGPDGILYISVGTGDIWDFSDPREVWALGPNGDVLWKACPLYDRDRHYGGEIKPLTVLDNGSLLVYTAIAGEESGGLPSADGQGLTYPITVPSMLFLIGPAGSVQKVKVFSNYDFLLMPVDGNRTYAYNGMGIEAMDRNWSAVGKVEFPGGVGILPIGVTGDEIFYLLVLHPYLGTAIVATRGLPEGLAERLPDILGYGEGVPVEKSVWPNDGSVDRVVTIMATTLIVSTALYIFLTRRERER